MIPSAVAEDSRSGVPRHVLLHSLSFNYKEEKDGRGLSRIPSQLDLSPLRPQLNKPRGVYHQFRTDACQVHSVICEAVLF